MKLPGADWLRTQGLPLQLTLTALLGFALLLALAPAPPMHPDTARDLLLARSVLEGGDRLIGAPTMLKPFHQLASWSLFLALTRAVGLGVTGQHLLVLALQALAAVVVYRLTWQHFSRRAAPVAALLALLAGALCAQLPLLWNPSLLPLPAALLTATLVRLAKEDKPALVAQAGIWLALCTESHIAAVVAWPVLLVQALLGARPWLNASLALGVPLSYHALLSPDALLVNAEALRPHAVWLAAGFIGLVFGAWVVRRWRARFGPATAGGEGRPSVVLLTLPAVSVLVLLGVHLSGLHQSLRYVGVAVPGLAVALATLPFLLPRYWRAVALLGVAALALGLAGRQLSGAQFWRSWLHLEAIDGETLARQLRHEGVHFADLPGRLYGMDNRALAAQLAVELGVVGELPAADAQAFAMLAADAGTARRAPPPPGWTQLARRNGGTLALRRFEPWVSLLQYRVCCQSRDQAPLCIDVDPARWRETAARQTELTNLWWPAPPGLLDLGDRCARSGPPPYSTAWHLPIVPKGEGDARIVALAEPPGDDWRIAGSTARRQTVTRTQAMLVVERRGKPAEPAAHICLPPNVLEVRPQDGFALVWLAAVGLED